MSKYLVAVVVSLALLAGMVSASAAQTGSLDPTFSGDGVARNTSSSFSTVQIDAQDRVIVGGSDSNAGIVLRYKANGVLDSTWKPYHLNPGYGVVTGIVIDGAKTLVGTSGNGSRKGGYLIRLDANGTLDKTFGIGGVAAHIGGCTRCGVSDLGLASSGVVFATSTPGGTGEGYVPGGFIKVSPNGRSTTWLDCPPDVSYGCGSTSALTVSPDYVYVAGDGSDPSDTDRSVGVVARYFLDGSIDPSYGVDGYGYLKDGTHRLFVLDIAVSPKTGEVTIVGSSCPPSPAVCDVVVARLTAAGALDPTFHGVVNFGHGPSNSFPTSVTMQSGKVVIAGLDLACNNAVSSCFGVERLTPTGAYDKTFAGTGHTNTPKAPSMSFPAIRIFNQRIVLAGGQYIARYVG